MSKSDKKTKPVPNAMLKLICMFLSLALMVFSVTQVYYLLKYTLGHEVSKEDMAVYNWVVKLVSYDGKEDITEQEAYENAE